MKAMALLLYFVPVLVIVGAALGVSAAGLLQYRLAARLRPELRLACVVLIVALGALLSVALTSRTLDENKLDGGVAVVTYDDLAGGFAASRWLSLALVAASLIEVARGWLADRARARPDPARGILLAMLGYYGGTMLIQAVASDHPDFETRNFYVPIVLAAVYYQRPRRLQPVIEAARWSALTLTLSSLAFMWLRPDFVVHRPELGWIPGVDWRLFGLAPHANALGPVALLGVLIELHAPARRRLLRWTAAASAAAVLVLAQSKTTWGTLPLMGLFVWLPLSLRRAAAGADPAGNFRRTVWTLFAAIVAAVALASAAVAFDALDVIERRSDIATLTGRTQIWDITLQAWRENVLFGYGAGIWGPARQLQFHMFHVGHAHNQVVQTLGESGLVGLLLLLAYLGTLLAAALRGFVASRGMVLMLLMLMLVLCVTEAPMRGEGLLSWTTFLQVLLVAMACWYVRAAQEAKSRVAVAASAPPPPARDAGRLSSGWALHGR
jgi:O-antigen ligase